MYQYTTANTEQDRDREEAMTDCRFQHPSVLSVLGKLPQIKVFKPGELTRKDILPSEADNG